ncbi:Ig-like domain-containing protein [Dysgonomonas reticulitermitis]
MKVTYKNTPVSGNVLTNDFDMEGHIQTVTTTGTITTIEGGNVQINADGTYVYTPKENFTGCDSFTYTICDDVPEPFKACDRATVSIIVNNMRNYWHGTIDNNWAKTANTSFRYSYLKIVM